MHWSCGTLTPSIRRADSSSSTIPVSWASILIQCFIERVADRLGARGIPSGTLTISISRACAETIAFPIRHAFATVWSLVIIIICRLGCGIYGDGSRSRSRGRGRSRSWGWSWCWICSYRSRPSCSLAISINRTCAETIALPVVCAHATVWSFIVLVASRFWASRSRICSCSRGCSCNRSYSWNRSWIRS
jgi:hypothetical protein